MILETRYARSGDLWIAYQVFGEGPTDVHIGARVAALAGPGEILISRVVRDLVVGSGIGFEDRGAHELRGVPGEWDLFAAVAGADG